MPFRMEAFPVPSCHRPKALFIQLPQILPFASLLIQLQSDLTSHPSHGTIHRRHSSSALHSLLHLHHPPIDTNLLPWRNLEPMLRSPSYLSIRARVQRCNIRWGIDIISPSRAELVELVAAPE